MAVTNFSPLLGLALPTTGDLSGTWGTTVNDSITSLIDSAVAGTTTLSVDTDVTLSTTNGASNQARNAVILWTASNGATTRNITAPAQSKAYIVINAGTGSIVIRGSGPTTGVTIASGEKTAVAWNGSDFVKVAGVASVSVATANGFAGTSSGGANPTLTLTTSVTGVLKGNGTAISAATAGTDYLAPPSGTALLKANSGGALANATAGTDYVAPGGALGTPSSGTLSSCTVDGTNSVGFLNIPQNAQASSYTLVLADAGKHIYHASGDGAATYTIPANSSVAYPIGTAITFINMSATTISIAITSDTMYFSSSGLTGTRALPQYGSATALKIASTVWLISGSGMT